jgi:hypothetical protein
MENVIERGVILGIDNGPVDSSHLFTSGERFDGSGLKSVVRASDCQ